MSEYSTSHLWLFLLIGLMTLQCSCKENMPKETVAVELAVLEKVCQLPGILIESSGLVKIGENFFSINDKGGANEIYQFNENGHLLKTFTLVDGENHDWEDLSVDESGNLYIADTGNNDNDRRNLQFYKINSFGINEYSKVLTPEVISFEYEDQNAFPPEKSNRHFDCEAVITINGNIHLFTKDRSKPFTGISNHYILRDNSHQAIFQKSFQTENNTKMGAITGAANTANGKKIVLTSNRKCWVFSNYVGSDFFTGTVESFVFNLDLKIEGVFFGDDCTLYFTDEKFRGIGMNLYKLNICP